MAVGLVVLSLAIVAGFLLTRPQRLADITAGLLERATGAGVVIDRAYLSLDGGLQLEGVRFSVPDLPAELARLGDIESVRVTPDLWALGRGELRVRSIVLLEPTLYLTRHADDDRYNLQHLLRPSAEPGQQLLIDALPEIFIRGGLLRVTEVDDAGSTPLGAMGVEGRLTRDLAEPALYRFALHQQGEQLLPGVVFHGSLDLLRQRITTELHGFQFTRQQQQLLPAPLRALWDRLDPAGEMPRLTLRYDPSGETGLDAELRVQNVSLNVPAPGVDARLRNVTGVLRLQDDRLAIQSLAGEVEGIPYHIEGEIGAFDLDAPLRLRLVTEPFEIDQSPPPYLAGLPDVVHEHYARYEPAGRFQTTFEFRRHEVGGPLKYDGTINVLGASGRYARFPVPVHDLRGQVHISDEQVRLVDIRGRTATGGDVLVEGTVTPPRGQPAVDLHVQVRSGAVDEQVLAALQPNERQIVSMFMHEPSRARLLEAGLIRDQPLMPWQWQPRVRAMLRGKPEPPTFAFGGRMNVDVHVTRERGPAPTRTEVHLEPDRPLPVLFEHWAYPLYLHAGRVIIGPETVQVEDLRLQGLSGGAARLAGQIQLKRDGVNDVRPELDITDARLPIDALLLASLPTPQDRWLRRLDLAGELTASGTIADDEQGETDFAILFDLEGGEATPYGGAFTFTDISSQLLLRRDGLELRHLQARRGEGRFTGGGELAWAGERPVTDLAFTAEAVGLEAALLDLLPSDHAGRARALALFERHEPGGTVDADLYFGEQAGPDAAALTEDMPPYRLVLRPRSLNLTVRDQLLDLHELGGSVALVAGQAELDDLTAHFDAGQITANGLVMLDERGGAALQVAGQLERLEGPWLALLPDPLTRTLEALDVTGPVQIEPTRLLARPGASDGPRLEAVGMLKLENTRLHAGLPIKELMGELTFNVAQHADQPLPRLNLQLEAERLLISDREVTPLTMTLRSDDAEPVIRLENLHGRLYGGVLVGEGVFDLQADTGYRIELALQDVQLDQMLAAARDDRDATSPPRSAGEGRLNAGLTLSGKLNDVESRRGRGAMEIRHARLYHRPVALALLQAVNLSLPLSGSFDRGAANFLVDGETVYFDDLTLEAPSVAIHGNGTMHYPTGQLNLNLHARNPAGVNLGVISDVFNLVKDQLIGIRITGTMDEPRARVVGLEDISRPWNDAATLEPATP